MRTGPAIAVAVVIAVAAWLVTRSDESCSPVPTESAAPSAAATELVVGARTASDAATSVVVPDVALRDAAERIGDAAASDGAWALAVLVVDALGEEVEGARVELAHVPGGEPFTAVRTDAAGRWRGPVHGDTVFVRASLARVGTSVQVGIARDAGGPLVDHKLMLLRVVPVAGIVIGAEALPLAAATVMIEEKWTGGALTSPNVSTNSVVTDAAGRFVFEAVMGAELELQLEPRHGAASLRRFVDGKGEWLLACVGAFAIQGVVVDGMGKPLQAEVDGHGTRRGYGGFTGARDVVKAGEQFVVPADGPGVVRVAVRADGFAAREVEVTLTLTSPRASITVVMDEAKLTRGKTVDQHGGAVHAGEYISIRAIPADPRWSPVFARPTAGAFEMWLAPETTWTLIGEGQHGAGTPCRAGDQDVRVVVHVKTAGAAGVRGGIVVFPDDDASGVAEVRVEVLTADLQPPAFGWLQWFVRNRDGYSRSTASAKSEGQRFTVTVRRSEGRALLVAIDEVTKQTGFVWVEPHSGALRLVLQPPVPLDVAVRHADGSARGVTVDVQSLGMPVQARVGRSGVARFAAVPHGVAVVRVLRGNEVLATREIELKAGEPAKLTVDVEM